jgi:MFS family permease
MHYREYIRFTEIGVLFNFIAFLIVPVLSPYIKSLGFDIFQIGLIFSLYPLSVIIFSPILGRFSDTLGRKITILFGIVMVILAMFFYILAGESWFFLALARVFNGLGYITVILVVLAKIEDSLDGKTRGKYLGWSMSLEYVSKIIAPVVGGLIADYFFVSAPFFLSITLLIVLSFYFIIKERPRKMGKVSSGDFNIIREIREFLSNRTLRGLALQGVVMHASLPATVIFLPLLMIDKFGVDFTLIGFAYFVFGFFHLFQFYFGKLSDSAGRRVTVLPGTMIFGVFMILAAFADSYFGILLALLFMGMGGALWNISTWSMMSDIGESIKKEGQVVMTYASISKIGTFVSYILGGLIALVFGIESLFIINGIVIIIGTVLASRMILNGS